MILTNKQEEALKIILKRYRDREKYTTVCGYAGVGKAQPVDTKIPTPDGFKKLGELKIGDFVFDRKGEPTKILGVFPQGQKKVYKVEFKDGRSSLCAGDHLWTIYNDKNEELTKTTLEILGSLNGGYQIPLNLPTRYQPKDYESHPYSYGVYLGKRQYNKDTFIPECYKLGSIEQRFQLLRGILDSIGSIDDSEIRITSLSKQFIYDIQEILWSLGFIVEVEYYDDLICLFSYIQDEDKPTKLSITNIEELDYDTEMVCILVDNEEHLYLTEDYIVTHNTTIVKFAIEALGVNHDRVAYATFTGKAAEVLRRKGNPNAMTLHKLLYDSSPLPNGGFRRVPKTILDYDVVVVDEISMAPKSMLEKLLKHHAYCIFMGDNFQLPQIDKSESHDFLEHPHVFLDEVMRQAAESEIIQLTMMIREGKEIPVMKGKDAIVIPKNELVTGHLLWADQILCATNAKRYAINQQVRGLLGFSGDLPQDGEKVIIKRNYWDFSSSKGNALVNGTTGYIKDPFENFRMVPSYILFNRDRKIPTIMGEFITEDNETYQTLTFDKTFFLTEQTYLDWKTAYTISKNKKFGPNFIPIQGTFGYAITVHSAQGSQWDNVLVVEEDFPFDRREHARWLYTACTRPSEKLVLVKK